MEKKREYDKRSVEKVRYCLICMFSRIPVVITRSVLCIVSDLLLRSQNGRTFVCTC